MSTEEQMIVNERRKYLKLMKPLYQQAKRGERSRLLSEMQEVTGCIARACYDCCMPAVWPARSGRRLASAHMD